MKRIAATVGSEVGLLGVVGWESRDRIIGWAFNVLRDALALFGLLVVIAVVIWALAS